MDAVSLRLYQYLCNEVVGSEKVVKYRRQFFDLLESIGSTVIKDYKTEFISSGSKAEGLDLPGSDLDVMFVFGNFVVYEIKDINPNNSIIDNIGLLIIDTDHAQPGFVMLKIWHETFWKTEYVHKNEFGTFFVNGVFRSIAKKHRDRATINGPCITDSFGRIDNAHCLRYPNWPSVARHWIYRSRSSGFPSVSLINTIVNQGVLLVPIGSKSDSRNDNPLEWRISFSVPEKMLIHSWTHTQILCYALLKILLKDVIKKNKNIERLLCSYFLKTTLFWLSEELGEDAWTPDNLLHCFMLCMKRLIYWITHKYIPNYFIPEHNMIDRKIAEQSPDQLLTLLNTLYDMGWQCILLCVSLNGFNNFITMLNSTILPNIYTEFEKAIFPLFKFFHGIQNLNKRADVLLRILSKYFIKKGNTKLPAKLRSISLIVFSRMNRERAESLFPGNLPCNNKQQYYQYKRFLSHCLIGANSDALSGWLLLAVYFYSSGDYSGAITVLDYTTYVSSFGQIIITEHDHINLSDMNNCFGQECRILNFLRKVKYKTALDADFFANNEISRYNIGEDLCLGSCSNIIRCPSLVFRHFLRFLCYHRLHDITPREISLQHLARIVTNNIYKLGAVNHWLSYLYLQKAFEIVGDQQGTKYCANRTIEIITSNDVLRAFKL